MCPIVDADSWCRISPARARFANLTRVGVLELDRDVNREGQILTGFEDRQRCGPPHK
jgi:hypothetical protein